MGAWRDPFPSRSTAVADRPAAEHPVTGALVRALLAEQHPDLAELALTPAAEGWDNTIWRLGEDLAVRMPRRELSATLVHHEQRWLPVLAPRLPVAVPVPVRVGVPGHGYPWHWSVVPWFTGRHAIDLGLEPAAGLITGLAGFLGALHVPAPPDHPVNPFRGVPLAARDDVVRERLTVLAPDERRRAEAVWRDAVQAPVRHGRPVWLHGDLHPGNLVVSDAGTLAAVVDFGDLTAGDPAVDLAVAWSLFDTETRARFVDAVTAARPRDAAVWRRSRGWALSFATALLTRSDDDAAYRVLGRRTLAAVLTD